MKPLFVDNSKTVRGNNSLIDRLPPPNDHAFPEYRNAIGNMQLSVFATEYVLFIMNNSGHSVQRHIRLFFSEPAYEDLAGRKTLVGQTLFRESEFRDKPKHKFIHNKTRS